MSNVQFPEKISGQWIGLKRLKERSDVTVLLRRNFFMTGDLSDEPIFFVSANTSYQLFINGRPAGMGPRAHQCTGTSYIDAHEIGFYLEPGNNLIALCVHYSPDQERGDFSRFHGVWCQLQCGGKTLLESDENWQIMALDEFMLPRPRVAAGARFSTFADLRLLPSEWNIQETGDEGWEKPDLMLLPGISGALIELHPVPPAVVSAVPLEFTAVCEGNIGQPAGFSCCEFPAGAAGKSVCAVSYVFCEEPRSLKVKFYADDPFKFFCNKNKLAEGAFSAGQEIDVQLVKGLNRLVVFSRPGYKSMGFMFVAREWPEELTFLSDMIETAAPGWCVGIVSRVKYRECTPAVRIESLPDISISLSDSDHLNDICAWLKNSTLEKKRSDSNELVQGDWRLFKLSGMHYGNVRLSVTASAGDKVDLIIGTELDLERFFPLCANGGDRELVSFICREGKNEFGNMLPVDCSCVLVYIRRAKTAVDLEIPVFDELSKSFNRECAFSCSDPFWNQVWQTGRASLSRSGVALFPSDGCARHDLFMLDSFLESANVAAVFGDSGYIAARLRQFAGAQLENGAVPSLSSGNDYDQALIHMFFFSGWILYNYRFSGNMVELRSLLPKLDAAKRYLVSLLKDDAFFIDPENIGSYEGNETDPVACCRLPVVLNALFCRFMISASEIYDLVERTFDARECRRFVRKVSEQLIERFFDSETGLFADEPIEENAEEMDFSLLGNFFPLLAGIKTEECFEKFVKTFFDFKTATALTVEAESPYFHYLFVEMLFALGQKEWGFRYLKNYWEQRMDHENMVVKDPLTGIVKSCCFANGSSTVPNVFLVREIVGVRLAEPAHSLIYFDPSHQLVDQAEAAIPTTHGRIHITWQKQPDGGLEVNIYASHKLRVLPELSDEVLKKSTFRLSDNVTLVKSAAKEG